MSQILFIGGTGELSGACVEYAFDCGHDVTVFNRGTQSAPEGVEQIAGDLNSAYPYQALAGRNFDVVCQFLAFTGSNIRRDIEFFKDRCRQYIFVSSATVYQKPWSTPILETTPLGNAFSAYGRSKAKCEEVLRDLAQEHGIAATIVRPSHTYRSLLPGAISNGLHQTWRMLQGLPVVVHDRGESLWTLTHSDDFARAFVGLCDEPRAHGEIYHITSEHSLSWRDLIREVGAALDLQPELHFISSKVLAESDDLWRGMLLGDKANNTLFDNRKIKTLLPGWSCNVERQQGLLAAAHATRQRIAAGYKPSADEEHRIARAIANNPVEVN